MSQSIWTQCAENFELTYFEGDAWRVVESQFLTSTRKLVDSDHEQEALESLIDTVKPLAPDGPEFEGVHYVLSTSFRYAPLQHGSRFGRRTERSLWYGSHNLRTGFAEVAYYRLLFIEGTTAKLGPVETSHSALRVDLRSEKSVDLMEAPFSRFDEVLASPAAYQETQALGAELRDAGTELIHYRSARDQRGGKNVAAFTPKVFRYKEPRRDVQSWHSITTPEYVEFTRQNLFQRENYRFVRDEFLVDGALPSPAV